MTTELEKQFFLIFDIKPKYQDTCTVEEKYWQNEELANEFGTFDQYMNIKCGNQENCTTQCSCAYQKEIYPQITDRHYLELICVLNKHNYENYQCCTLLIGQTVEKVKKDILTELIENLTNYELNTIKYNKFKHQVQAIFKESEQ